MKKNVFKNRHIHRLTECFGRLLKLFYSFLTDWSVLLPMAHLFKYCYGMSVLSHQLFDYRSRAAGDGLLSFPTFCPCRQQMRD